MNKFSCFIPFFLVVTSYLITPSLSDQTTQDFISQICRTVSDPGFCFDQLNKNLPSPQTDLPGLTRLTTGLALAFARDTETFFQKVKEHEENAGLKKLYEFCESKYHSVVGFMQGAKYDADRADFVSMVNLLQLCGPPVIECQTALGDIVYAVRSKNAHVRTFISMGLKEGTLL
ncbi:hypothetical protein ACP275_03G097500 [Erythranthe tilingii]